MTSRTLEDALSTNLRMVTMGRLPFLYLSDFIAAVPRR